jgi:riboflavin synthase
MFTGIIEEIGTVRSLKKNARSFELEIGASSILSDLKMGDSISINGACHTVVKLTTNSFFVNVTPETRRVSTMGNLKINDQVNLEKPLTLNKRLGGHLVQGHVDTVGKIIAIQKQEGSRLFEVAFTEHYRKYVAPKGSICIDGISLTIAACKRNSLTVSIIPHTLTTTTMKDKKNFDSVNLEFDIIAKYVESLLASGKNRKEEGSLDLNFFSLRGF